jgi:PKD repeat protein
MKRKIILISFSMSFILSYSFVKLSNERIGKIEAFDKSHLKNTGGSPAGRTGAPGESNCTECHSGAVNDGSTVNSLLMKLEGTSDVVTQYIAGQTYDLTLTINATSTKKGFQAVALRPGNTQAGTITAVSGSTAISTANSRTYINHTSTSTGSAFFSFKWTAPSSNIGDVKFYVASNASNNAQGNSGDLIYLSQHTITPLPVVIPTASFTSSANELCSGSSISFTNTSTGFPTTYFWSFPGGTPQFSNEENPTVSYPNPGIYTAMLAATNSAGTTEASTTITVFEAVDLTLGTITNTSNCGNTDGSIQIDGSGSGTLLWTGTTNGSVTATLPFTANNFGAGSYTFTFNNGTLCESNEIVATIIDPGATATPVIISNDDDNILCQGSSLILTASLTEGLTWSNGAQTQSIDVTNPGDYFVTYTENGCSSTSLISTVTVISCASLADNNSEIIVLYPNPTSDQLTIKNIDITKFSTITLVDLKGKIVTTWKISSHEENFNLEAIESGSYFIKIIGSKNLIVKPIIKF